MRSRFKRAAVVTMMLALVAILLPMACHARFSMLDRAGAELIPEAGCHESAPVAPKPSHPEQRCCSQGDSPEALLVLTQVTAPPSTAGAPLQYAALFLPHSWKFSLKTPDPFIGPPDLLPLRI
jgi:hypothetical protein